MTQLNDRTTDIGGSVGSIYTSQVLANLYTLANDTNAMPSHFMIAKGTINASDTVTPSVTLPLGNQVTRVAVGGISQVLSSYNSLGLTGTETVDQIWEIIPERRISALWRLRSVYLYVLGKRDRFDRHTPKNLPEEQFELVTGIYNDIQSTCQKSPCFKEIAAGNLCAPHDFADAWVCLDKYGNTEERATLKSRMMISREAYSKGILFDLVSLSLQAQEQADLDSKADGKAAETRGDDYAKTNAAPQRLGPAGSHSEGKGVHNGESRIR